MTDSHDPAHTIAFNELFQVCWAGPNPLGSGFCFGSDDGRLLLVDEDGKELGDASVFSPSREPVNGVAGLKNFVAVSTRADVSIFEFKGTEEIVRSVLHAGSHGV